MIFKRPYAFLIKYFKIIHFILALLFIYIGYKSYNIMVFFNDYISNNYSGNFYNNYYMEYISPIVMLCLYIIIILLAIILWLLIFKKKPTKSYITSIIYYSIIIINFMIIKNIMINMETNVITAEISRIYRDMSLILLIPQIFFIILFIVRALGLNIDKFQFEKDIKELEISTEDNEEIELTFKNDGVKLKRVIRRYFREFKYYLLENKLIVSIIGVILLISIVFLIINLFPEKTDDSYKQGKSFYYNGITYTIKDSIITNLNYNGDIITKDKYYVVLLLNIINKNESDQKIDFNNFRLLVNNNAIYPILDKGLNFVDYAKDYNGLIIKANNSFDYSLVFEINKEEISNNYQVKFMAGSTIVNKKRVGKYNNITITPSLIDKLILVNTYNLKDEVKLINSNLGNTTIKINGFEVTKKYVYDYESCYKDKCNTYKGIVDLDYLKNNKRLLILDYEYELDNSVPFINTSKTINGFMNYFAKIKYKKNDEYFYSKVKDVTPNNINNKVVLEVTSDILTSDEIYLSIIIRNKEFLINLK